MVKLLEKFENNQLPSLETDRLILRARTLDDLEDIYAYASLPEVTYPANFSTCYQLGR